MEPGRSASLGNLSTALVEVAYYRLRPGGEERFEGVLKRLAAAPPREPDAAGHLWFQRVVGGETPAFLLLVPRASWADLGSGSVGLERLLERALGAQEARALAAELTAVVDRIETETWSYRADLSYIPPEP